LDLFQWNIDERDRAGRQRHTYSKRSDAQKILLPLVALAAGTPLGGALLHMIPAAIEKSGNHLSTYLWTLLGFTLFLALEQFLHWHHCHRAPSEHRPLTY
jgi:zinc and cadmium transporter